MLGFGCSGSMPPISTPAANSTNLAHPPSAQYFRKACDKCRARKYKCTGEPTGCTRCVSDGVGDGCRYSVRGIMGRPPGSSQPAAGTGEDRTKKRRREISKGGARCLEDQTGPVEQDAVPPMPIGNILDTNYNITLFPALDPGLQLNRNQLLDPWEAEQQDIHGYPDTLNGGYIVHTTAPSNNLISQDFRNHFVVQGVDNLDVGVNSWPFPIAPGFGVNPFDSLEMDLSTGDAAILEGLLPVDTNNPDGLENMMVNIPENNQMFLPTPEGFASGTTSIPAFGLPEFTLPAHNLPGQQRSFHHRDPEQPCPLLTLPTCLCPSTFHECHKALQSAVLILQAITGPTTPTPNTTTLTTTYITALTMGNITLNTCRNLILCSVCRAADMPNMLLVGTILPVMVGVYGNAIEILLDDRFYGEVPEIAGLPVARWRRAAVDALRRDMKEAERIAADMVKGAINGARVKLNTGEGDSRVLGWRAKGEAMDMRMKFKDQERGKKRQVTQDQQGQSSRVFLPTARDINPLASAASRSIPLQKFPQQAQPIPNNLQPREGTPSDSDSDDDETPPCLKHIPKEQWRAIVEGTAEDSDKLLPPCVRTVMEMQDHVLLWTEGFELLFDRGMNIDDGGDDEE